MTDYILEQSKVVVTGYSCIWLSKFDLRDISQEGA